MRAAWGLTVALLGAAAAAQTRVDADATAGVVVSAGGPADFDARGAVRLEAARTIGDFSVFATFTGELMMDPAFHFADLGSEVGAAAKLGGSGLALRLDLFPLNGIRVREAFDWANVWGRALPILSNTSFQVPTPNFAPAARLTLLHDRFDVWAALSGYPVPSLMSPGDIGLSGLAGFAIRGPAGLALEVRGGVHDRGHLPQSSIMPVDEKVLAYGGTARLSWSFGGGVSPQVDLVTYAKDPERYERFFAPDAYDSLVAAWVGLEGGVLSQNLFSPAGTGPERTVTGYADGQARLRVGPARFFVTGRYQPAELIVFDAPGLPSFFSLDPTTSQPRLGVWAGADVRFDDANLELGILGRVLLPALAKPCVSFGGMFPPMCGATSVVRDVDDTAPFNGGQRSPLIGTTFTVRWAPMRALTVVTAFDYERDSNTTLPTTGMIGGMTPGISERFRVLLFAQARF